MTTARLAIMGALCAAMVLAAFLRLSGFQEGLLTPLAGLSTPLYITASVFAAIGLIRTGLSFNRLGFGFPFRLTDLLLALAGVAVLQLYGGFGPDMLRTWLGTEPGAGAARFDDVAGSVPDFLALLALNWTVAATGEELTFRIILMRGLLMSLGGGTAAAIIALVVASALFGFIHLYKGPVGMISSGVSGLVFGSLVLLRRGAIWPAFLCHGINNTIGILRIYADG